MAAKPKLPLYKQLLERPYPQHQSMDTESAMWILNNAGCQEVQIYNVFPSYEPFPLSELAIEQAWFSTRQGSVGLHGINHGFRTSLYAWILLQLIPEEKQLTSKEAISFLQAAMLHDVRRINDNADPEHGRRTAIWLGEQELGIDQSALAAVALHADEDILPDASSKDLLLLEILKTADALDRYRLPKAKWWPKKDIMPLVVDDNLFDFCKYITVTTELETSPLKDFDGIKGRISECLVHHRLI